MDKDTKQFFSKFKRDFYKKPAILYIGVTDHPEINQIHTADSADAFVRSVYNDTTHEVEFYFCQYISESEQTRLVDAEPYDDDTVSYVHANNAGTRDRAENTIKVWAKKLNYEVVS